MSRTSLLASAVALAFALLLLPAVARAQATVAVTITNPTSLARVDANGNGVTKRPTIQPEGINLQDCRDALQLVFPLNVTGFSTSDNFEVWGSDQSGADCTVATARSGATQTCYKISANFSRTQTQSVNVSIKELIKGLAGTTLPADGCRRVNAYTISAYFLVLRGTDVVGHAKATLSVDTQGPTALSNVKLLPGEAAITVSWDAVGEGGADDVIGAQAFCDPSPTQVTASTPGTSTVCKDADGGVTTAFDASDQASLADAGVTCSQVANEGGTSGGGPIPLADSGIPSAGRACMTQSFAPVNGVPIVPDNALRAKYGCGSISGSTGSTVRIDQIAGAPPVNGHVYAVAIAATDSFGNLGDLSAPICQFPEQTSDFWRDYRGAGGQSGGGFCSVEGPGIPVGSFSLVAIGVVVAFSSLRRVRRVRIQRRRNDR